MTDKPDVVPSKATRGGIMADARKPFGRKGEFISDGENGRGYILIRDVFRDELATVQMFKPVGGAPELIAGAETPECIRVWGLRKRKETP